MPRKNPFCYKTLEDTDPDRKCLGSTKRLYARPPGGNLTPVGRACPRCGACEVDQDKLKDR